MDFSTLKEISTLDKQKIKEHIESYTFIYIDPVNAWRNVVSNGKKGFDLIVSHLIYYLALLLLVLWDFRIASLLLIAECVLTLIPFVTFLTPFLICRRLFKKSRTWKALFRILLLIKIQCIPFLSILYLIGIKGGYEPVFILFENILWLPTILSIIVLPMILKLRIWQKLLWITFNYLSFIVWSYFLVFILSFNSKETKLEEALQLKTPTTEYLNFYFQDSLSRTKIDDSHFVVLFKADKKYSSTDISFRFASPEVSLSLMKSLQQRAISNYNYSDSLLSVSEPQHERKILRADSTYQPLELWQIDSIYHTLNSIFYHDLELYKTAKDSSFFDSNKAYFKSYYDYLNNFENLFREGRLMKSITTDMKPVGMTQLDDKMYVILLPIESSLHDPFKQNFEKLQEEIEVRIRNSNIIAEILFFIPEKAVDFFGLDF
jgi:hypothetical protein